VKFSKQKKGKNLLVTKTILANMFIFKVSIKVLKVKMNIV